MKFILDELCAMYEKKKIISAKIATTIALAMIAIPSYFVNDYFSSWRQRTLPSAIVNELTDRCKCKEDVNKVLLPHLIENPSLVDQVKNTAGKMVTLSWALPKEPEKTKQVVNVSLSGDSRVDVGTNSYFTDMVLGKTLEFYPELRMLLDSEKRVLYKLSDSTQRLVEPIRGINNIVKAGDQHYLTQNDSLFLVSSNKLVRVDRREYNLKEVPGTPFAAAFTYDGFKVLGEPRNEEERKVRKGLEEQITRVGKIHPCNVNRISYNDGTVFIFNGGKFISLTPGQPVHEFNAGKDISFVDYAVTKDWNFATGSDKDSKKGRTIVMHQLQGKEHSFVCYNEIDYTESERVSGEGIDENYRFPNNPSLADIPWVSPSYVKARVSMKIIEEIRGKKK